tara:strand:- start:151 stop:480 length:330 start_codon:yes stop_codon:yes gene_type:complete
MHNEPLKITLEFYNKKISTKIDHSDLELEGYCLSFYAYKDIEKLEKFIINYTKIKDKNNNMYTRSEQTEHFKELINDLENKDDRIALLWALTNSKKINRRQFKDYIKIL